MSQFFDEALQESRISRATVRVRDFLVGLTFVITLAAMGYVFLGIDQQLERSSSVDSDNAAWTVSQVEVDTLKLQRAVLIAVDRSGDPQALDDLRLSFDIFYSRFNVLAKSDRLSVLPVNEVLRDALWSDGAFFDRVTPLMDGDDAALTAALPAIADEMNGVADLVRANVMSSLQELLTSGDALRAELRRSLQLFAAASLGLLALMAGLSLVIILQNRAQSRRSETTERAVHNLRAIIESSLDALVICDAVGKVTDCNRAAEQLFGRNRADLGGLSLGEILSGEGKEDDPFATLYHMFHDGTAQLQDGRCQLSGHRRDGSEFPVEVALAEAKGAGGGQMFIAFIRDISERIEREESLRKARNDALKGEEAKARFLAVMSHEMRTPLNGLDRRDGTAANLNRPRQTPNLAVGNRALLRLGSAGSGQQRAGTDPARFGTIRQLQAVRFLADADCPRSDAAKRTPCREAGQSVALRRTRRSAAERYGPAAAFPARALQPRRQRDQVHRCRLRHRHAACGSGGRRAQTPPRL
ncbi:MAG: hypothetical protein C0427_09565 [Rhodobacter sp.]|nr:hypothetical protein [Rhodobacter sp.]